MICKVRLRLRSTESLLSSRSSRTSVRAMGSDAAPRQPSTVLNLQTKFWNAVGVGLVPILKFIDDTALLGRAPHPAPVLPVPHEPHAPTSTAKVDEILKGLDAHKLQWVNTGTKQRADLLGQVLANVMQLAPQLARIGAHYKGSYEAGDGEEM